VVPPILNRNDACDSIARGALPITSILHHDTRATFCGGRAGGDAIRPTMVYHRPSSCEFRWSKG
jgi:hypothetical protein